MFLHPRQRMHLAEAHADRLRRDGGSRTRASAGVGSPADVAIVIRLSRPEDERALEHLAGLDSARVPAAPMLVAEADGALRAARSLHDGAMIADPFHRTAPLAALLATRAEQVGAERAGRRRWFPRLRFGIAQAQRSSRSVPQVEPADS